MTQRYIHDLYLPISHAIGDGTLPIERGHGVPAWIPDDDARRLRAYQFLAAARDNGRRYWLPPHMWQTSPLNVETLDAETLREAIAEKPQAASYREYGDAGYVVDTARSLVLGEDQRFRVPDAEPVKDPDTGEVTTPDPGSLPVLVRDFLEEWSAKERLHAKIVTGEERTVGDGDTVYAIAWSPTAGRPRLRTYDAGFYFPDLAAADSPQYLAWGWDDADYPPVVHIAWEYLDPRTEEPRVRRSTYRMVKLDAARALPYGGSSPWTCMFNVDDFALADLGTRENPDLYTAQTRAVRLATEDLGVDFMPVVHVPNDATDSHFGRSILLRVSQILDDLASADTDLAINAQVVASPQVVSKNATQVGQPGPGNGWWDMFGDGQVGLLDTSKTLDALLKHQDGLHERLARNSRLGQVLLGMVTPDQVPSGYAMRLGFAAVEALVREMRLIREEKYPLLGKMAVRVAQVHGMLPAGDTPRIEFALGNGLPVDRAAAIDEVRALLAAAAISTHTAVQMLIEAGLPIEDADAEVARIRSEQTDRAVQLVEATGDVDAARERLGLPPAAEPAGGAVLPAPELPAADPAAVSGASSATS